MRVGVPAEVTDTEFRVALTPAGVHELIRAGHEVTIETGAGAGSSLPDEEFAAAGAAIAPTADDVWGTAELVLKVKEPTPDGSLPLLAPMSEVAGRMAPQVGAYHLQRGRASGGGAPRGGGRGVLLSGASGSGGVRTAKVVVLGAGTAGLSAAAVALRMGARVLLLDADAARLRAANARGLGRGRAQRSSTYAVERAVLDADLVIGAVLVLVDISIDQGGCFADSCPTIHSAPAYQVHDSVFYCVANMPGAVPHTSTYALTHVTLPYALAIANRGWREALRNDDALARGLNAHEGSLTCPPVAEAHDLECVPVDEFIA